jgi:hypothetical protein
MGMIKAYTDLEQSKKLAEILPLESADMRIGNYVGESGKVDGTNVHYYPKGESFGAPEIIYAWSLAALLGVLPFHLIVNNQRYAFSMHKGLNKDGETYIFRYNVFNTDICLYSTDYYNNPIDACVTMIEKLNELNLL